MKNMKWWIELLVTVMMAGVATGAEITLEQAEMAVGNWIDRGGAFGKFASPSRVSGETFEDADSGAKMHVVHVPGKGFAVTSTDDGIDPIIFFSDGDGDLVAEEGNPMWDLLRWDLSSRKQALEDADTGHNVPGSRTSRSTVKHEETTPQSKWADLLNCTTTPSYKSSARVSPNGKKRISDIRRVELLDTEWGQTFADVQHSTHYAYNYYTPGKLEVTPVSTTSGSKSLPIRESTAYETNEVGHYPCGCVATAGGQLMRKWKYPPSPKSKKTVWCKRDGESLQLTMKGGPYNWSGMGGNAPSTPSQCEAVGRILYDIGVSCGAKYTASGTSMSAVDLATNLRTVFGYKSATWFGTAFYEFESTVVERLKKIAIPNLDAEAPILLSIKRSRFNEAIDHCVVADGYGYDNGEFSIHINFGWNGTGNGWYVPPSFHPDSKYDYDFIRGVVGNVFPHGTGSMVSGRAEGSHGRPISGAEVQLCNVSGDVLQTKTTGSDGVYWFMEEPGAYMVKIGVGSASTTGNLTLSECGDASIGNAVQDWSLTSVPTVASVSVNTEGTSKAGRDAGDTTFATPFDIRLSSRTAGAEIRYTLDGTQPTSESTLYEGPIAIQDTTTLRAVAYADGMECSEEFSRTWTFNDPTSRDNFADARPISGASGMSSFNNEGYTKESGEPTHSSDNYPGGASAWAVWTAPESGDWTFRLSGVPRDYPDKNMDTQLAVYTGNVVSNLTLVAANDDAKGNGTDYSSRVSFSAEKGKTYHIAMDSYRGDQYPGALKLEWEEGYVHYVQVEYTPQWVPVSGGQQEMKVDASTDWYVMECSDWISPENNTGRPGDNLNYVVATNGTGSERSGYITLQAGNSEIVTLAIRQHSLDFVTTKEEALERAWRENKRILLIWGRESCSYTTTTMFSSLPTASVRALLDAGFVLWYSNCDRQSEAWTYVTPYNNSTLPVLAIVDPLDTSAPVAGLGGQQSASAIQSLLQTAPSWSGFPPAKIELESLGYATATVSTKIRVWGLGASSATVTLETGRDAAFSSVTDTRTLGTATALWTEQKWTFPTPVPGAATFCRVRVSSGNWSVVSDVIKFMPLVWGYRIENGKAIVTNALPAEGALEIPATLGGYPVTSIGDWAFSDCSGLTSVTIPYGVTNIGAVAFSGCSSLTNVTIPNSVTSIGDDAFWGCSGLTSVTIPDSVTSIGKGAFKYCSGLTNVTIPDSVMDIGMWAFDGCSGLTSVTIPYGVTNIGYSAFAYCTGLTSVTIPDSITGIGYDLFSGCNSLKTLYVPASWETVYCFEVDMLDGLEIPEGCTVVYVANQLDLGTGTRTFTAAAASGQKLAVTANVSWTAKSSASWLTVATASGSGNGTIAYSVAANTTTTSRSGTITVTGGELTRTFTVTQNGAAAKLDLGSSERTFTADAASGKLLGVTANVSWTAKSSASWLTVKTASGSGNGNIEYAVSANTGAVRTGTITVSGGGLTRTFTVTQAGKTVTLELAGSERTFTADAASGKLLGVTANVSWTAKSSASWLTVKTASGSGSGNVEYAVAANTGAARTGTITVSGGGLTRTYAVTQRGKTDTQESPVGVPRQWLDANVPGILAKNGGDYEAAAKAKAANGRTVWECYVAGLSPTDAKAEFKVQSISFENGKPVVEWNPDMNDGGTKSERTYEVQGKPTMADDWGSTNAASRFFRVKVTLP